MGGNLGDVRAHLRAALSGLSTLPGTTVEAASSLYQTRPVEATGPDYLNAVIALDTTLAPRALLEALLAIEHDAGRTHSLALTQQGPLPTPENLLQPVGASGGDFCACTGGDTDYLERARQLRQAAEQHDLIVLHTHPHDVVPLIALAGLAAWLSPSREPAPEAANVGRTRA